MTGIQGFVHARRALEMGFTTIRDCGDIGWLSVSLRNLVEEGFVEGPRILSCGKFLSTSGGHADFLPHWISRNDDISNVVDGPEEVLKAVRLQLKMRTDWIKFFATGGVMDPEDKQEFNEEELNIIINEAHNKGKPVCAHCIYSRGTLAAVKAGLDSVEHGSDLTEEIIDLMKKRDVFLIPTNAALSGIVKQGKEFGLPDMYIERTKPILQRHIESFKMALDSGIRIACGSDAGFNMICHGMNAKELELLVELGMSPMDAIITATRNSASALGLDNKVGTLEKGKFADLVVVNGDPLSDITILQDKDCISLVMKEGIIYKNILENTNYGGRT
jgi:imidazolonepropionase-like amidohydrolase